MGEESYFRYAITKDKEKFLDDFQVILEDLYKVQRKRCSQNKEKKGFVDGFMHAGIMIGLVEMEELQTHIDQVHLEVFGKTLEERKALIKSAQLSEDVLDIPTFHRLGKNINAK